LSRPAEDVLNEDNFARRWDKLSSAVNTKEINALVKLVTRSIWLERNISVFEKIATLPVEVCHKIRVDFAHCKRAWPCGYLGEIKYSL
jgi:hypothetical protein